MRTGGFLQAKHRFFGKTALYVVPPERCLEIDEPFDFQVAEWLLQSRSTMYPHHPVPQQAEPGARTMPI
jgi:CMP-N-acetylneuraminic acid synthetase